MSIFYLAADFGLSQSKFAFLDSRGKPRYLLMQPHITKLETIAAAPEPLREGEQPDLESSWVADLDNCYVLGRVAREFYRADARPEERKYEAGIYKLLAVMGYLSEVVGLPNGTTLNLGLLLPFSEYRDADLIWRPLELALKQFQYCGVEKSFVLGDRRAFPEGAGVYTRGLDPKIDPAKLRIGVLVSGHRNQSWLRCDYGRVSDQGSYTNTLGFSWLVEAVQRATSIQDEEQLTQAIFAADNLGDRLAAAGKKDSDNNLKEKLFSRLIQSRDAGMRSREMTRLVEAIIANRVQYWVQVQDWLNRRASEVDLAVFCGGSAVYLRRELRQQYKKAQWGDRLLNYVGLTFGLQRNPLAYLILDVMGVLFLILPEASEKQLFSSYYSLAASVAEQQKQQPKARSKQESALLQVGSK